MFGINEIKNRLEVLEGYVPKIIGIGKKISETEKDIDNIREQVGQGKQDYNNLKGEYERLKTEMNEKIQELNKRLDEAQKGLEAKIEENRIPAPNINVTIKDKTTLEDGIKQLLQGINNEYYKQLKEKAIQTAIRLGYSYDWKDPYSVSIKLDNSVTISAYIKGTDLRAYLEQTQIEGILKTPVNEWTGRGEGVAITYLDRKEDDRILITYHLEDKLGRELSKEIKTFRNLFIYGAFKKQLETDGFYLEHTLRYLTSIMEEDDLIRTLVYQDITESINKDPELGVKIARYGMLDNALSKHKTTKRKSKKKE